MLLWRLLLLLHLDKMRRGCSLWLAIVSAHFSSERANDTTKLLFGSGESDGPWIDYLFMDSDVTGLSIDQSSSGHVQASFVVLHC